MEFEIVAPRISTSDTTVRVVELLVAEKEEVSVGRPLMAVEGTKAVVEVSAERSGRINFYCRRGEEVAVGTVIATITDGEEPDRATPPSAPERDDGRESREDPPVSNGSPLRQGRRKMQAGRFETAGATAKPSRFSVQAERLLAEHSLPRESFAGVPLVTGKMIEEKINGSTYEAYRQIKPNGRVIVAGAGAGVYQLLTILQSEKGTTVIGIVDDNEARHGEMIGGVKVVGGCDLIDGLSRDGKIDSLICSTPNDLNFRRRVREFADEAGLSMANAIHSSAVFDAGVRIGTGNFIGAFCYFGAETVVGDDCFLSSRTTFEHHNRVGDLVTTGPNVATSGLVSVGDNVHFGTGIFVEPGIVVGDSAVIASGAIVMADVVPGSVLKIKSMSLARRGEE